jgi:dihydroxyacetone kinase-like protein
MLVNGLGATPAEELHLIYSTVDTIIKGHGMSIERTWIGEYATSLDMAGTSISLLRLDDELRDLLDKPARSPFVNFP